LPFFEFWRSNSLVPFDLLLSPNHPLENEANNAQKQ
jgi:hypothetical protein